MTSENDLSTDSVAISDPRRADADSPSAALTGLLLLERLLWLAVVAAAALLRLAALGSVPLSALEGHAALPAWLVAHGSVAAGFEGGVAGALSAVFFKLLGDGDGTARLASALGGIALIAAFALLRRHVGRRESLLAAALAACSPVLVLDARSASGESWGALFAVLLLALLFRFLEKPGARLFILLCATASIGLATDAVFVGLGLLVACWLVYRTNIARDEACRCAWAAVASHREWWRGALPLSLAGLLLAVSRFGAGFDRLRVAALNSWAHAFAPQGTGGTWHFSLDVLAGYEGFLSVLAVIGAVIVLYRRRRVAAGNAGLLLLLAGGGIVLDLLMASRDPSTLVLTVLPCCLLGGIALARFLDLAATWRPDVLGLVLSAGLTIAVVYCYLSADEFIVQTGQSALRGWIGLLLAIICLAGAFAYAQQERLSTIVPVLLVLLASGTAYAIHSASAAGFGTGDEFLRGGRTTREGRAIAGLVVNNGGGVSTVTDAALPSLAWYLRETVANGGHGRARLIQVRAGQPFPTIPTGFLQDDNETTTSRTWYPSTIDPGGMLRWWIHRKAWGPVDDVRAVLEVVEDR